MEQLAQELFRLDQPIRNDGGIELMVGFLGRNFLAIKCQCYTYDRTGFNNWWTSSSYVRRAYYYHDWLQSSLTWQTGDWCRNLMMRYKASLPPTTFFITLPAEPNKAEKDMIKWLLCRFVEELLNCTSGTPPINTFCNQNSTLTWCGQYLHYMSEWWDKMGILPLAYQW